MTQPTHTTDAVKAFMEHLIDRATSYDVEALETIYHNDLHIVIVEMDNSVKVSNKREFITFFSALAAEGREKMNDWTQWHHIHVNGNDAVAVLTRKNDVAGDDTKIRCSIDLVFEDGRWQVIREEIFQVPNN
ncbi:nuclear transport factor 2 family protein [Parendozoicomonas haliclonae]|uniref:nuclear transport factor 2 family protein n=1 Tax=Parendozoicomonas haliclonae TaxID=1960125 RepID=UPI001055C64E|nr:nuclear transport factor 2 family protein [Parendozoicomonas haliclonae]